MFADIGFSLIAGLLGSAHCVGMCGGFVLLYSSRVRQATPLQSHLLYNGGRITTYVIIGAISGAVGSLLDMAFMRNAALLASSVLLVASGALMLFGSGDGIFGSGLSGTWPMVLLKRAIERLRHGTGGWPLYPLGLALGLVPCGLVYTMAVKAASSADPVTGGLVMLAFGLGTFPALAAFGALSGFLTSRYRQIFQKAAAVLIIMMGVSGLVRWTNLTDSAHDTDNSRESVRECGHNKHQMP
ncbi:MAG: sulfite exporter TauE/SafE family protein [Nitrospirae bacterium]|nr:sulfite exporter TauE/SafE family protein [Nitrospirota bacterium]